MWTLARWHQTLDYGYLPNPEEPNMFLALALDTYRQLLSQAFLSHISAGRLMVREVNTPTTSSFLPRGWAGQG